MVFVVLLVFLIVFLFMAKLGMAYAAGLTQKMVTESLQDTESILNRGAVPARWVRHIERRVYGRSPVSLFEARFRRADRDSRAKQELMGRLDSLARYLQDSPFVEDPVSRKVVVEEFRRTHAEWETLNWSELARMTEKWQARDQ
jgi:hypothetical protein